MKLFLAVFFVLLLATCDAPVEPQVPDAQLQTIYGDGLSCADCANAIQAMIQAEYNPPAWCTSGSVEQVCEGFNSETVAVGSEFAACVWQMGHGWGGFTFTAGNHVCMVGDGGGGGFSIQPGEFIEATGEYEGLSDVANEYIRGVYDK